MTPSTNKHVHRNSLPSNFSSKTRRFQSPKLARSTDGRTVYGALARAPTKELGDPKAGQIHPRAPAHSGKAYRDYFRYLRRFVNNNVLLPGARRERSGRPRFLRPRRAGGDPNRTRAAPGPYFRQGPPVLSPSSRRKQRSRRPRLPAWFRSVFADREPSLLFLPEPLLFRARAVRAAACKQSAGAPPENPPQETTRTGSGSVLVGRVVRRRSAPAAFEQAVFRPNLGGPQIGAHSGRKTLSAHL